MPGRIPRTRTETLTAVQAPKLRPMIAAAEPKGTEQGTRWRTRWIHPKNACLREADVLGRVDGWLAELFGPASVDATLSQLARQTAQLQDPAALARAEAARARIVEYDAEIGQYRASLKAGGDAAVVGPWIAETQAKKVAAQAEIRAATGQRQMTPDDVAAIVAALGDLAPGPRRRPCRQGGDLRPARAYAHVSARKATSGRCP